MLCKTERKSPFRIKAFREPSPPLKTKQSQHKETQSKDLLLLLHYSSSPLYPLSSSSPFSLSYSPSTSPYPSLSLSPPPSSHYPSRDHCFLRDRNQQQLAVHESA